MKNEMQLQFKALSNNESFARITVAAFVSQLDPTMDELTEIKTVISEAVTNAVIHGYNSKPENVIYITVSIDDRWIDMTIKDEGLGIKDIEEAREPLFTTKPDLERSGMGFTIMENFMDEIEIKSELGRGTEIRLRKQLTNSKMLCK